MLPIEWSFELLCAGLETRQPQFSFNSNGVSILVGLSKSNPTNVDYYCDANKFQLNDTHPDLIVKHNNSRKMLQKEFDKIQDLETNSKYHYISSLMGKSSFWGDDQWWPIQHLGINVVSPIVHWVSSHYANERWCQ
jgi:hypothetical protein